jgi:hypothetical protein
VKPSLHLNRPAQPLTAPAAGSVVTLSTTEHMRLISPADFVTIEEMERDLR